MGGRNKEIEGWMKRIRKERSEGWEEGREGQEINEYLQ